MTFRTLITMPVLACLVVAAPALAQPKLVSSTPADGSVVSRPTRIALNFSEKLTPQLAVIELTMTAMPGMAAHKPMKIVGFTTSVASDGETLVATLPRPLPAGTYALKWRVVSIDTHHAEGTLSFTVK